MLSVLEILTQKYTKRKIEAAKIENSVGDIVQEKFSDLKNLKKANLPLFPSCDKNRKRANKNA